MVFKWLNLRFLWKFYIFNGPKETVLHIYRRGRAVQLSADIRWKNRSSIAEMKTHLLGFVCSKKSKFRSILKEIPTSYADRVELKVECGKVAKRSCFIFLKGSRNKSHIVGTCYTDKLVDLVNDFDFLKAHMNESNLMFSISDPKVFLENTKLFASEDKRGLQIRSVLADVFGIAGFVSGAISYFVFGEINQITMMAFVFGLASWIGSIIFTIGNRPNYILIQQE